MLRCPPFVLLATLLPTAVAINITVPAEIIAGVATEIEIGFDLRKQPFVYESFPYPIDEEAFAVCRNPADPEVGCRRDMLYESYQLFLDVGTDWGKACYLSDPIPVGTTNPKIAIPKDLGPSQRYKIAAMEFNGTRPGLNKHGDAESEDFTLVDTEIDAWTEWESTGGALKPWYSLPCSSSGCFSTCGLRFADEHGNRKQRTVAGLFDCLNECPSIRADWNGFNSEWRFDNIFDGVDWSGGSTAVTTTTPSAVSTSGWSRRMTTAWPETMLYGTPTARPSYSAESVIAAKPTATTQSSAARRRAKPPVPKQMSYGGAMVMTLLMCLVAFGIGSLLGWIWPDGLRSEW